MAAATTDRGIPLSTLSTKFLHTNSTSHTGPFSAIAELIDNAYDPDVNAEQIWINKIQINNRECLTFMDDGNGLSRDLMQKMLSFGFSEKVPLNGKHPIGMYGNGFKSGSMRLGEDAIVLSKSMNGLCVGMLSQTYLEKMGGTQVAVPIFSINEQEAMKYRFSGIWENRASLRDILEYSPFNTEEELLTELHAMESTTGTKIIIWNLRRTSEGKTELNFTAENDIRIPCDDLDTSVPESNYSLRAYCSILYLKPSMQIYIQGQKVEAHPISESLEHIITSSYKPQVVKQKIPIIFGYNTKSMEHYGLMMYYNNRLIKAYHRVGCQLKAKNRTSIGVIGVIECNYLKPTHNKQDFEYTSIYKNTLQNVAKKLREYCWNRKKNLSDNVPIKGTNDEMTDNNDELQETSGEGTSGTKRPRRNGDEGESERHMNLRSSTAPTRENMEISRERELLIRNLTQENQELLAQIDDLHLMVEQLEGKKASTCQECEQNKARVAELTEFKRRMLAACSN